MDDVLINKAQTIERCLQRIREEYIGSEEQLTTNFTKQDSIILNLQRACEAAIDMANHIIRVEKLGAPQFSRESFAILAGEGILSKELAGRLQNMVGFRNIAIHDYTKLNMEILRKIVEEHLPDFSSFSRLLLRR